MITKITGKTDKFQKTYQVWFPKGAKRDLRRGDVVAVPVKFVFLRVVGRPKDQRFGRSEKVWKKMMYARKVMDAQVVGFGYGQHSTELVGATCVLPKNLCRRFGERPPGYRE